MACLHTWKVLNVTLSRCHCHYPECLDAISAIVPILPKIEEK